MPLSSFSHEIHVLHMGWVGTVLSASCMRPCFGSRHTNNSVHMPATGFKALLTRHSQQQATFGPSELNMRPVSCFILAVGWRVEVAWWLAVHDDVTCPESS